jgi:hydrogenase expression/formation protein HypD
MKHIDEFRDDALVRKISQSIRKHSVHPVVLMEVCGGHTTSMYKFGLHSLLPETVKLLSGPGCPVCVSGTGFIDTLIKISGNHDVIIVTYGDLIRVPGSSSSLGSEKNNGSDVRVIYSVMEALDIAVKNPSKMVVFPGIGFETTTPSTGAAILQAERLGIKNFKVLSAHKTMPPVMEALIDDGVKINGYIAPGHVSAITGISMYKPIAEKYGLGVVVSGFEPLDLLQSILMLVLQFEQHSPKVENQYRRVVKEEGNPVARKIMNDVFEPKDDWWRGLGMIPQSGLGIRKKYESYDALHAFSLPVLPDKEPQGCICGQVLKGMNTPLECKLFSDVCTPSTPVGACMVSQEGTCSVYYRFKRAE